MKYLFPSLNIYATVLYAKHSFPILVSNPIVGIFHTYTYINKNIIIDHSWIFRRLLVKLPRKIGVANDSAISSGEIRLHVFRKSIPAKETPRDCPRYYYKPRLVSSISWNSLALKKYVATQIRDAWDWFHRNSPHIPCILTKINDYPRWPICQAPEKGHDFRPDRFLVKSENIFFHHFVPNFVYPSRKSSFFESFMEKIGKQPRTRHLDFSLALIKFRVKEGINFSKVSFQWLFDAF